MALAEDIRTFLLGQAGLLPAPWEVYIGEQPPSPDRVVTLYETGGSPHDTSSDYPMLTFQIRIRAAEYPTARDKLAAIMAVLHNATITGYVYVYSMQSAPVYLGKDAQAGRPEFSMNFRVMKASFP